MSVRNQIPAGILSLDLKDELSGFRNRFYIPQNTIYMDGNSLGLLSVDSEESLLRVLDEWKKLAIKGWTEGKRPWFWFAEEIGTMASKLVGADPGEVIMSGSTTVNIHALISSFFTPEGERNKILADELNFPSDLYALKGQLMLKGFDPDKHLVLAKAGEKGLLDEKSIIELMTDETALVFLPSVLYHTGQLLDIKMLTEEAAKRGILTGFDCSHSAGSIPHRFNEWGVDFALWCSYKYLNGGPGSTAFFYVNKKHFGKEPFLAGWFGCNKEKQFDMLNEFIPSPDAGRWQISSPAILSSAPVEGALKITLEAGIDRIRKKSVQLTTLLAKMINERIIPHYQGFRLITPTDPSKRGGHIAIEHPDAAMITEALKARGVIPDLRPPSIIRIAPVALYNSFSEVWKVVDILAEIMKNNEYVKFRGQRRTVT